jgi:hypothetical protein
MRWANQRRPGKKTDEKDLFERSPWRDPNAIPPMPIEPLMIDPEVAIDIEEASLVPQLNGDAEVAQLGDAIRRVATSGGSPEAKAEMFSYFASQINRSNRGHDPGRHCCKTLGRIGSRSEHRGWGCERDWNYSNAESADYIPWRDEHVGIVRCELRRSAYASDVHRLVSSFKISPSSNH